MNNLKHSVGIQFTSQMKITFSLKMKFMITVDDLDVKEECRQVKSLQIHHLDTVFW